ncbi:MAG: CapA family protein [Acidobacteria bacterium]|nr:CapA family protein [Acidobacteriota bacterium]
MRALENNLELVSARYAPKLADSDVTARQAAFDLGLEASFEHRERQRGTTQPTVTSGSKTDTENVGISQDLKFGANYTAGFLSTKRKESGGGTLPGSIFSAFQFDFTLPILRGFGTSVATEQLVLARNNAVVSRHDLMTTAGLIMEQVEGAYWDVVAAREIADVVVVSLHSGKEYADEPNAAQVELSHAAIDAGALLVIGHHPHTLQGLEEYNGGLIAYSLGNFVFDLDAGDLESLGPRAFETVVLYVTLTEDEIVGVRMEPVFIDVLENRPRPATEAEARAILERVDALNELVGESCEEAGTC